MALSSLPPQSAEPLQQVHTVMRRQRVGLWLVGAFGGVGTTITLGLSAMARGLSDRTGLVSELPMFRELPLAEPGEFVVGGHDIRETSYRESAEEFRRNSGVFPAEWIAACVEDLDAASARVRPGTSFGAGPAVARLGHWGEVEPPRTARQAVDQVAADMAAFVESESIGHMIVLNVASTEPPFQPGQVHRHWDTLNAAMADGGSGAAARQRRVCRGGAAIRLHLHQLHAQRGCLAAGPGGARRVQRRPVCRQGWQDRRDLDEDRARADVRAPQPEGHELGRPQHLRQPRRADPRRSRRTSHRRSTPRTGWSPRSSATSPRRW